MPSFNHIVETPYKRTFRSSKIEGLFDIDAQERLKKEWKIDLPIENRKWNIGVIVGPSGSGKTSIGKIGFGAENYHSGYEDWDPDCSIVESFPKDLTVEQITQVLSSVGFSSPPSWLQPYRTLSNGQKFRVEMARVLFDPRPVVVVDEFTSVVDRNVAKIGSSAIAKTCRKLDKQLVLLSCHYDILEWLEPDWIYYMDRGEFEWGCLRRPKIEIKIQRCHRSAWRIFREHHYLNHGLVNSAQCYIATINDEPAGFFAYVKDTMSKKKNVIRGHRSVVLPDYQGVGVGAICSKAIMKYYSEQGCIVKAITSHPAFIASRGRDPEFRLCNKVVFKPSQGITQMTKDSIRGFGRVTATFQYVGDRDRILKEKQLSQSKKNQKYPSNKKDE